MADEFEQEENMEELLRDMVASNLTVAYQMELLRRDLKPKDETVHPFAHVLEVFEMVREIMAPGPDMVEEDVSDSAPPLANDGPPPETTPLRMPGAGPFDSTIKYLKPKRLRGNPDKK